ncbi:MAG: hypothetical protein Q9216_000549 [Gyalolechia sp. 2 TL-2023]
MDLPPEPDKTEAVMSLNHAHAFELRANPDDGDHFSHRSEDGPIRGKPSLPYSRTPQRVGVTPNSRKKRVHNLSRCSPGYSHHDQVSTIFQDAGRALHPPVTPRPSMANARKIRTSPFAIGTSRTILLDADNGGRSLQQQKNSLHEAKTQDQISRLLISSTPLLNEHAAIKDEFCDDAKGLSGQNFSQMKSPILAVHPTNLVNSDRAGHIAGEAKDSQLQLTEVVYPDLSIASTPAACHPSDTVPCTTAPKYHLLSSTSRVENWLTDVIDHGRPDPAKSSASSDIPSVESTFLPGVALSSIHPHCHSPHSKSSLLAPERFNQSPLPRGYFTEPSTRKLPCLLPVERKLPGNSEQEIVIYEDESSGQLAELSPSVQRYRKGHGPKRKRCVSYWDTDILPELANLPREPMEGHGQREVLGELTQLTRAKTFAEGVENAQFDFEVPI